MKARALAPEQALNSPSPAAPSMLATSAPATEETAATVSRPCGGAITADSGVDCIPTKVHRSRSIPAANERPAIAAVAIGHRDEPAMLPAPPAPAVPAAPSSAMPPAAPSRADTFAPPAPPPAEAAVETAAPEAVPPPRAPAPAPAKKKAPPRRSYAQHRERGEHSRSSYRAPSYSYSYGYGYMQGGWGRIW